MARCSLCGATSEPWSDEEVLWTWQRVHLAYRHAGDKAVFGDTEAVEA